MRKLILLSLLIVMIGSVMALYDENNPIPYDDPATIDFTQLSAETDINSVYNQITARDAWDKISTDQYQNIDWSNSNIPFARIPVANYDKLPATAWKQLTLSNLRQVDYTSKNIDYGNWIANPKLKFGDDGITFNQLREMELFSSGLTPEVQTNDFRANLYKVARNQLPAAPFNEEDRKILNKLGEMSQIDLSIANGLRQGIADLYGMQNIDLAGSVTTVMIEDPSGAFKLVNGKDPKQEFFLPVDNERPVKVLEALALDGGGWDIRYEEAEGIVKSTIFAGNIKNIEAHPGAGGFKVRHSGCLLPDGCLTEFVGADTVNFDITSRSFVINNNVNLDISFQEFPLLVKASETPTGGTLLAMDGEIQQKLYLSQAGKDSDAIEVGKGAKDISYTLEKDGTYMLQASNLADTNIKLAEDRYVLTRTLRTDSKTPSTITGVIGRNSMKIQGNTLAYDETTGAKFAGVYRKEIVPGKPQYLISTSEIVPPAEMIVLPNGETRISAAYATSPAVLGNNGNVETTDAILAYNSDNNLQYVDLQYDATMARPISGIKFLASNVDITSQSGRVVRLNLDPTADLDQISTMFTLDDGRNIVEFATENVITLSNNGKVMNVKDGFAGFVEVGNGVDQDKLYALQGDGTQVALLKRNSNTNAGLTTITTEDEALVAHFLDDSVLVNDRIVIVASPDDGAGRVAINDPADEREAFLAKARADPNIKDPNIAYLQHLMNKYAGTNIDVDGVLGDETAGAVEGADRQYALGPTVQDYVGGEYVDALAYRGKKEYEREQAALALRIAQQKRLMNARIGLDNYISLLDVDKVRSSNNPSLPIDTRINAQLDLAQVAMDDNPYAALGFIEGAFNAADEIDGDEARLAKREEIFDFIAVYKAVGGPLDFAQDSALSEELAEVERRGSGVLSSETAEALGDMKIFYEAAKYNYEESVRPEETEAYKEATRRSMENYLALTYQATANIDDPVLAANLQNGIDQYYVAASGAATPTERDEAIKKFIAIRAAARVRQTQ